jgi:negative regulator of flagellin synthesis FlgM
MKIGNPADKRNIAPVVTTPADAKAADKTAASAANPASVDPSAKVQLSNAAASLRAGTDPAEFDAAKVERVSQAIADGSYKVNPEVIADKLIANAQELLGKVQR